MDENDSSDKDRSLSSDELLINFMIRVCNKYPIGTRLRKNLQRGGLLDGKSIKFIFRVKEYGQFGTQM